MERESVSRKNSRVRKQSPRCPEGLALSNRLFEVGLDIELAKTALDGAKARAYRISLDFSRPWHTLEKLDGMLWRHWRNT